MKIFIGADHRGFKLKEDLKVWLQNQEYEVVDVGAATYNPDDDYVDFAVAIVQKLLEKSSPANFSEHGDLTRLPPFDFAQGKLSRNDERGVLICGSGVGMEIVVNRARGIRCGLGLSPAQVAAARNDDDINILSIAADYTNIDSVKDMTRVFLETPFSNGERHLLRIKKIDQMTGFG